MGTSSRKKPAHPKPHRGQPKPSAPRFSKRRSKKERDPNKFRPARLPPTPRPPNRAHLAATHNYAVGGEARLRQDLRKLRKPLVAHLEFWDTDSPPLGTLGQRRCQVCLSEAFRGHVLVATNSVGGELPVYPRHLACCSPAFMVALKEKYPVYSYVPGFRALPDSAKSMWKSAFKTVAPVKELVFDPTSGILKSSRPRRKSMLFLLAQEKKRQTLFRQAEGIEPHVKLEKDEDLWERYFVWCGERNRQRIAAQEEREGNMGEKRRAQGHAVDSPEPQQQQQEQAGSPPPEVLLAAHPPPPDSPLSSLASAHSSPRRSLSPVDTPPLGPIGDDASHAAFSYLSYQYKLRLRGYEPVDSSDEDDDRDTTWRHFRSRRWKVASYQNIDELDRFLGYVPDAGFEDDDRDGPPLPPRQGAPSWPTPAGAGSDELTLEDVAMLEGKFRDRVHKTNANYSDAEAVEADEGAEADPDDEELLRDGAASPVQRQRRNIPGVASPTPDNDAAEAVQPALSKQHRRGGRALKGPRGVRLAQGPAPRAAVTREGDGKKKVAKAAAGGSGPSLADAESSSSDEDEPAPTGSTVAATKDQEAQVEPAANKAGVVRAAAAATSAATSSTSGLLAGSSTMKGLLAEARKQRGRNVFGDASLDNGSLFGGGASALTSASRDASRGPTPRPVKEASPIKARLPNYAEIHRLAKAGLADEAESLLRAQSPAKTDSGRTKKNPQPPLPPTPPATNCLPVAPASSIHNSQAEDSASPAAVKKMAKGAKKKAKAQRARMKAAAAGMPFVNKRRGGKGKQCG